MNLGNKFDKAKAIREASTRLREISLTNMIPSIDIIKPFLGLSDTICSNAKDLYRFRSRNISHPGKSRDDSMSHWLNYGPKIYDHCLADTVAKAFLLAYCENFSK